MYRTNSTPRGLSVGARWMLMLIALCMLVSAAPCIDVDADEVCEQCDQDDVITATLMTRPRTFALLLEPPSHACLTPAASPAARFPHPPIS